MKRSGAKHNRWHDHYSQRAKKERYPARSVYKLKEIQKKHRLIKKGDKILDLGCAPGSWLLYAADVTGNKGQVVGIDLVPVKIHVPSHVKVHTGDILSMDEAFFNSLGRDFNVVMSDMAPSTTGNRLVDSTRSYNLCQTALTVARTALKPGGAFVCKIFQGEDFKEFSDSVKAVFNRHKIFKPQSTRKVSKEIYIIGFGKK